MTSNFTPRKPSGLSLIDSLIVTAIVAIIAGVSLGANQKAREVSALHKCINNIRGLGIGVNNYYSSALCYPTGKSRATGKTFYYTIRQQMEVPVTSGGPAVPVAQYLCPSRRSPSTVGNKAPADYGYSNSSSSILGSSNPVKQESVEDGIGNTILIGHIWVDPTQYPGSASDSPWDTCTQYARTAGQLYLDTDPSGTTSQMGSPHSSVVPHCFCDNAVRVIEYEWSQRNSSMLQQAWQYNRKAGTIRETIGGLPPDEEQPPVAEKASAAPPVTPTLAKPVSEIPTWFLLTVAALLTALSVVICGLLYYIRKLKRSLGA
jgi:hypothetical protein